VADVTEIDFSEQFLEAFKNFGGYAYDCSCGREHIDIPGLTGQNEDNGDSEEIINDEMNTYEKAALENDKLILHYDNESLEVMHIAGQNFVYKCECKGYEQYMNFMVQYRYQIKDFLFNVSYEVERMVEQEKVFKILKNTDLG